MNILAKAIAEMVIGEAEGAFLAPEVVGETTDAHELLLRQGKCQGIALVAFEEARPPPVQQTTSR
jgi:hypothetical protein